MLKPGEILDGRYKIIKPLGQGGWGCVYLAEHLQVGNTWAVKEIDLGRGEQLNLLAEPEMLKQLNHRSLPRIIDIIRKENMLYLIEDYFAGFPLSDLIMSREQCRENNVVEWAKQLCQILAYLHQLKPNPIIYRDMKPANIIINKDNEVRLVDFGIAREYKCSQSGDTTFIGTRGYAAPEQFALGGRSDERTDIYGLGATLYHTLTGISPNQPPYRMQPVRQIDKSFSAGFAMIIDKCVQSDPKQRYQKVAEVLEDLTDLARGRWNLGLQGLLGTFKKKLVLGGAARSIVKEKIIGPMIIAVGSTARGVGATHTSIAIASFLTRRNFRTAVVEMNETPAFYALEGEASGSGPLKGSFEMDDIMFYKRCLPNSVNRLGEILRNGYNYIILDLGQLLTFNVDGDIQKSLWYGEMNRADIPVLVSGSAMWQLKDLNPFIRDEETKVWRILLKTPDQNLFKEIQGEVPHRVFAAGFLPDPFHPDSEQDQVFMQLLAEILPKNG